MQYKYPIEKDSHPEYKELLQTFKKKDRQIKWKNEHFTTPQLCKWPLNIWKSVHLKLCCLHGCVQFVKIHLCMSYVSIKFYLIRPFPILKDVAGLEPFISMLLQCNGVIQWITIHQKFIGTPPYYV